MAFLTLTKTRLNKYYYYYYNYSYKYTHTNSRNSCFSYSLLKILCVLNYEAMNEIENK